MSSLPSYARVNQTRVKALRPAPLPRPRLTIVPKLAVRAPRIPFVLLVVTVLGLGLVGLLLLNTALQRGAYQVTDLRQTSADLALRQQNLRGQIADLQQPQQLAQQAQRLGMVRGDSPAFISLSTGRIVGAPVPGVADDKVDLGLGAASGDTTGGKVAIEIAGQRVGGAAPLVRRQPERSPVEDGSRSGSTPSQDPPRPGSSTKSGDTAVTSEAEG